MSSTNNNSESNQVPQEQYTVGLNQWNWANLSTIQQLLYPSNSKSWIVQKLITEKHNSLIKQLSNITQGDAQ